MNDPLIPKELVEKHRPKFTTTRFLDLPLTELSKDELMAAVVDLAERNQTMHINRQRGLDFVADLCKAFCKAIQ